ncbi:hypothetical protein GTO27_01125 [Candidatus Bathyarchaeota archaeon]|nr:hypothetical protein [Candidatus Bathyarchaeota archaeon]
MHSLSSSLALILKKSTLARTDIFEITEKGEKLLGYEEIIGIIGILSKTIS